MTALSSERILVYHQPVGESVIGRLGRFLKSVRRPVETTIPDVYMKELGNTAGCDERLLAAHHREAQYGRTMDLVDEARTFAGLA